MIQTCEERCDRRSTIRRGKQTIPTCEGETRFRPATKRFASKKIAIDVQKTIRREELDRPDLQGRETRSEKPRRSRLAKKRVAVKKNRFDLLRTTRREELNDADLQRKDSA